MTGGRYPTAVEREKAKLAGIEDHPADRLGDPLEAKLAAQSDKPPKAAQLRHIGGSDRDTFNIALANSVLEASWFTGTEERGKLVETIGYALAAIAPKDELEGMIAAQMVAAHQASMECYRRSMLENQTVEGRAMNLKQGAKASQTYAALLDTLNRHRAKGQQRVVVEHVHRHVHVHENGQPIVDHVDPPGGGGHLKIGDQSHAPRLAHSPQALAPVWREDEEGKLVSRSGNDKRSLQDARRDEPRRAAGRGKR